MVNYLYDLNTLEQNTNAYLAKGTVTVGEPFRDAIREFTKPPSEVPVRGA